MELSLLSKGTKPRMADPTHRQSRRERSVGAVEMNPIVRRSGNIKAGDTREASFHEFLARLIVRERPVLQKILIHFSCDLMLPKVALACPAWVWVSSSARECHAAQNYAQSSEIYDAGQDLFL